MVQSYLVPMITPCIWYVTRVISYTTPRTVCLAAGVRHCHGRVVHHPGAAHPVREDHHSTTPELDIRRDNQNNIK